MFYLQPTPLTAIRGGIPEARLRAISNGFLLNPLVHSSPG